MHNTPDDDIKFTRRDLLKKTVSGPLLAGSVGSVALTGLVNALVPNGGDSSYFPKCGFIQEIYAEPVDLDHPHTISIKTVHMRLYSQLTMAVQGTWRFSLNFSRMVPYPKKDNGELLFVNTIEVLGEFPGSPASASPGSRDTWTKKNIALSGWESIKKFSIAELHALNNGLWYITVDFMAHGNSPTTPTGAEPWIYVAESHFTPSYGIQVAPNSDKLPKNREQPEDLFVPNERKYGSTAIVLAEPRYTGVGDNVDKLVALAVCRT